MNLPDTRFTIAPPPPVRQTVDQLAVAVEALGYRPGWDERDDLTMIEALFMGHGLPKIAKLMGATEDKVRLRFIALRRAAVGDGVLGIDDQVRLLSVVRQRAGVMA